MVPPVRSIVIGKFRDMSRKTSSVYHQDTSDTISGHNSIPQKVSNSSMGFVGNTCSVTVLNEGRFFCIGVTTDFDNSKSIASFLNNKDIWTTV